MKLTVNNIQFVKRMESDGITYEWFVAMKSNRISDSRMFTNYENNRTVVKEFGIDSPLHFNSQAGVFGQGMKEMHRLLQFQNALTLDTLAVGIGDLYVTVYGGRTRLVGILLGRGLNIDEAKAELNGVTLESLVVAERVARAVKTSAKAGILDLKDFPLLCHIDEIISEKKPVNMPWDSFTYEQY